MTRSVSRPQIEGRASQRAVAAGLGATARAPAREARAGLRWLVLPKIWVIFQVTAQGWQSRPAARLPS